MSIGVHRVTRVFYQHDDHDFAIEFIDGDPIYEVGVRCASTHHTLRLNIAELKALAALLEAVVRDRQS